jgi:periplasmic divalent cation tolerance protein
MGETIVDDEATAGFPAHGMAEEEENDPATPDEAALLIYTTFPSLDDAKKTGRFLVEGRLAACVNIFPQITAIYMWDGKPEEGSEVAMLVKTTAGRRGQVLREIKRLHPYSVPARLVLPVAGGGADFLAWIAGQCSAAMPGAE